MSRLPFLLLAFLSICAAGRGQVSDILRELRDSTSSRVLVTAHRADWRNAPENSLNAIRRALRLGVDIIEVDVRRTKDGKFVIIHDTTLERTTTGKGSVADFTLAQIKELRLLAATGHATEETVPTLEEALEVVRGKAVINLDKSYDYPEEIFAVVAACRAVEFSLFSVNTRLDDFSQRHPGFLAKAMFMIVVPLWRPDAREFISEYLERAKPTVVQVTFDPAHISVLRETARVRPAGARLWFNSLWPEQSGGHDDERAVLNPDANYGWLLDQGATILQTDRPVELLEYLRARASHP